MKQIQLGITSPQMFELLQATKLNEDSNMITLSNCHQYTAQAVFNQAAKHLLKQSAQSLDASGTKCQYHGVNGLACAVGGFIPKDHGFEHLEDMTLEELLNGQYDHVHLNLFRALQYVHDADTDYSPIADWKPELVSVAQRYNLSTKLICKL